MSVFISYSRKDEDFVDELSKRLIKKGIKVWRDNFEMVVGQQLEKKIHKALDRAYFLLMVLSKNSIDSEWCKRELEIGLKKEKKEQDSFIIPIIIDNCEIPAKLGNRLFADFRSDFDSGFEELIKPLTKLYSEHSGSIEIEDYFMDYAMDWGELDGHFFMQIDFVQFHHERPYSILIQTYVYGDEAATKRWKSQSEKGLSWLMKEAFILMLKNDKGFMDKKILLMEEEPHRESIIVNDPKIGVSFEVNIRGRLLGNSNTSDVLFDYGSIIKAIDSHRGK